MTDVKRLLSEATPLPWQAVSGDSSNPDNDPTKGGAVSEFLGWAIEPVPQSERRHVASGWDAALIVYAVNHLPDYLAAVEALERVLKPMAEEWSKGIVDNFNRRDGFDAIDAGYAALRRLRDKVPA